MTPECIQELWHLHLNTLIIVEVFPVSSQNIILFSRLTQNQVSSLCIYFLFLQKNRQLSHPDHTNVLKFIPLYVKQDRYIHIICHEDMSNVTRNNLNCCDMFWNFLTIPLTYCVLLYFPNQGRLPSWFFRAYSFHSPRVEHFYDIRVLQAFI